MPGIFSDTGDAVKGVNRLEADIQARILSVDPQKVSAIIDNIDAITYGLRVIVEFFVTRIKEKT